jgi:prepilin-type N-terminal cleavage/methylation domain-containing protein/prepilin-type processing-associated H-X9-DG protein
MGYLTIADADRWVEPFFPEFPMPKRLQRGGFTLIELMVVIGIIAVLVSILLPAVNTARHKAKSVQCQANLRTLIQAFTVYCQGNNDRSFAYVTATPKTFWGNLLQSSGVTPQSLLCPEAYEANPTGVGSAVQAWNPGTAGTYSARIGTASGSYGFNGWLYEAAPATQNTKLPPAPTNSTYWHLPISGDSSTVPVFADSVWIEGWPLATDSPPYSNPSATLSGPGAAIAGTPTSTPNYMLEFCINRHPTRSVNVAFLDGHVDSLQMQQLWSFAGDAVQLRWSPGYVSPTPPSPQQPIE